MIRNQLLTIAAAIALGLIGSRPTAQAAPQAGCFWFDPIVISSPGDPLTGSGSGNFSGTFSNVVWHSGDDLGALSGSFTFNIFWNDADGNGIPWQVDSTVPGITFGTTIGDSLLAGDLKLSGLKGDCPLFNLTETKLLICTEVTDGGGVDLLVAALSDGSTIFVGNGTDFFALDSSTAIGDNFSFVLSDAFLGDGSVLVGEVYSTEGFSYYIQDKDSGELEKVDVNYNTIIKLGGCAECVPEPSGAMLGLVGGALLILRRRRVAS